MTKEEMKNKYSAFITEISEILGLGKPVDILKLCATTDLFFRPLEKQIADLERESEELKKEVLEVRQHLSLTEKEWGRDTTKLIHYKTQSTKAKELLERFIVLDVLEHYDIVEEAEQFLNSEVEK